MIIVINLIIKVILLLPNLSLFIVNFNELIVNIIIGREMIKWEWAGIHHSIEPGVKLWSNEWMKNGQ